MRLAKRAFTLVELLVVIAIIGILVALLLPAVQAAREAARRAQCTNQVKQIALAWHLHYDTNGFLPSGGWGHQWMADPDRGFGKTQAGSWAYSCLPYMEEQAVHQIGAGITIVADKKAALTILSRTPVAGFYCPTRRPPIATLRMHTGNQGHNANHTDVLARTDYAANLGPHDEHPPETQWLGGPSPTDANQGKGFKKDDTYNEGGTTRNWMNRIHGVVFQAFEYRFKHITDGTSKTYMVGEKYLMPETYFYVPGTRPVPSNIGDDQSAWVGDDLDTCRSTALVTPPLQDQSGIEEPRSFGSAHSGVFQMALCDASVRSISFDISPALHRLLGHRRSGEAKPEF